MRFDECWGSRRVSLFSDLHRWFEQIWVYLLNETQSETFEKFKEFQSEAENHRNKKIKFLRSDLGGEYLSCEFGLHLRQCGIVSQLTPPETPQCNGVSERRNNTLLDMMRSMMSLTDLPLSFWGYALETIAFTLNRVSSKSVETTPYELWFGKKPKLSFLKVRGCSTDTSPTYLLYQTFLPLLWTLTCMIWMKLTRADAVFSRTAMVLFIVQKTKVLGLTWKSAEITFGKYKKY